jgi:hypothetical protein
MRKAVIIIIVIIIGAGGYLGWDWYAKNKKQQLEPSIALYYWTDAKGNKYFSDAPPPKNARNVIKEKGYKHIEPPLIVTIKNKALEFYKKIKKKLSKPRQIQKK